MKMNSCRLKMAWATSFQDRLIHQDIGGGDVFQFCELQRRLCEALAFFAGWRTTECPLKHLINPGLDRITR